MFKRARSLTPPHSQVISPDMHPSPTKKTKADTTFLPNKIATAENAAKADQNQPIFKLLEEVKRTVKNPPKGDAVVYWMRMEDMRISDNTALSQASELAVKSGVPLLVLFVLSPQDYKAHDRGARRIDFTLRNLRVIQDSLAQLNIPLYTLTHTPRKTLPERVLSIMTQWKVKNVFANIEYEVDELRRDIRVSELARNGGIQCTFLHDKCVIAPGLVQTKEGRGYSVYSPFLRAWLPHLRDTPDPLSCLPSPVANHTSARCHDVYGSLFNHEIPDAIEGLELRDGDAEQMRKCWPAGENSAKEMLLRFLYTKSRGSQLGQVDPLADGAKAPDKNPKDSRVGKYKDARDRLDADTTSRLSPYLAAGVISARECIRATVALSGGKVDASRDTGIGRWVQEVVWRDFYTHVLAYFPRVSMGRPFQEKFANVNWETNEKHLQAWKDGRTGVPIVDAGMRQANTMGWMHNRVRMITAMYLVKDLMIDWRLGEQYFMETLIDGDLASNNGGWQWSASTGVDAAPYFRIFNPYTQSQKADPTGEYIRHFVPELSNVRGDDVHNPSGNLADKLKYPRPFVKHSEARERAIRRYKVPGQE
ncbi:DNA photolyase, FAD-binding/Cryptochrome [Cristinia sonorae]|uniref:DNA photolyase, FAD-binding/Cryptochrome n=1 Tax=Cristinia sonorae TaxID=1940300 RepID=A0A8K0UY31_9AGAR|nr:DNA photolyase, FAD-binding/Cryptochrome [Cristinia sonorae]